MDSKSETGIPIIVIDDLEGRRIVPRNSDDIKNVFFHHCNEGSYNGIAQNEISEAAFGNLITLSKELRISVPEIGVFEPIAFLNARAWAQASWPEGNDRGRIMFNKSLLQSHTRKFSTGGTVERLVGVYQMVGTLAHESYHLSQFVKYSKEVMAENARKGEKSMATGSSASWAQSDVEYEAEKYALDYLKGLKVGSIPEMIAKGKAVSDYKRKLRHMERVRNGLEEADGRALVPKHEPKVLKPVPPPPRRLPTLPPRPKR